MPRAMTATCSAQNAAKQPASGAVSPSHPMRGAAASAAAVDGGASASSTLRTLRLPIVVLTPNQPHATSARASAGMLAPFCAAVVVYGGGEERLFVIGGRILEARRARPHTQHTLRTQSYTHTP